MKNAAVATTVALGLALACLTYFSGDNDIFAPKHELVQEHAVEGGLISRQAVNWNKAPGGDVVTQHEREAYFQQQGTTLYRSVKTTHKRRDRAQLAREALLLQVSTEAEAEAGALPIAAVIAQAEARTQAAKAQAKLQAKQQKILDDADKARVEANKSVAKAAKYQAKVVKAAADKQAKTKLKAKTAAADLDKKVAAKKDADNSKARQRSAEAASDVAEAKSAALEYLHSLQDQEQTATQASQTAIEKSKAREAAEVQHLSKQESADISHLQHSVTQARIQARTAKQHVKAIQTAGSAQTKAILVAAHARTKETAGVKAGETVSELTDEEDQMQSEEHEAVRAMEKSDSADKNALVRELEAARRKADHGVANAKQQMQATIAQASQKQFTAQQMLKKVLAKVKTATTELKTHTVRKLQRDEQKEEAKLQVEKRAAHLVKEAATQMAKVPPAAATEPAR